MKITNKNMKVNINKINNILYKNWLLIGFILLLLIFSLFVLNSNKQNHTEETNNESNNNENNNKNIKEGFKAFDDCRIAGYPFKFCINIPFNSEGLYETWVQYNENQKYL